MVRNEVALSYFEVLQFILPVCTTYSSVRVFRLLSLLLDSLLGETITFPTTFGLEKCDAVLGPSVLRVKSA